MRRTLPPVVPEREHDIMKCPKCNERIVSWAPDCGRHEPVRRMVQSPFVRRALANELPASDQTGYIMKGHRA